MNHRHAFKVIKARMHMLREIVKEKTAAAASLATQKLYMCKKCRKQYDGSSIALLFTADGTRAKCNAQVWDGVCRGSVTEIEGKGGRPRTQHHAMRRNLMEKFKRQMTDRPEGKGVESFLNLHFPNDVPENLASKRVVALKRILDINKKKDAEDDKFVTNAVEKDPNAKLKNEMPTFMKYSNITGKKTSKARRDEAERKRKREEIAIEQSRKDAVEGGDGAIKSEAKRMKAAGETKTDAEIERERSAYIAKELARMRTPSPAPGATPAAAARLQILQMVPSSIRRATAATRSTFP